ncbi:MAG: hypothetical protein JST38_14555, partial [Bacteroidetes bacterium]|nr:hypothetical protein [Bacteroidota bacterium]
PRLGYAFNPAQLLLGDADGDGLTDVIYVEHDQITIWINQSGNGFSEPLVIKGTPSFTNRDSVRMVDLFGTGTPGILWSYDLGAAGVRQGTRVAYLDLTGGTKPYVMVGMRNNLGARTRVQYGSSVAHYLRDTYGPHPQPLSQGEGGNPASGFVGYAGKWKTTLPFPVQVVDRVEVIDAISKGKLTTRYFYHHGYWDGGEREFRGFGRVDQFDTETFDRYNSDDLILDADLTGVTVEHYAPPVLAKNWFHLGPVGAEKGDWKEVDFANEYWSGDANMLQRDPAMLQMIAGLPRRARRDAFRTLRGTALRSELYAMDGSPLQQRPYTVSETQTGLRLVDSPLTNATIAALRVETHSNHIFFSYGLSSRSTTWERGNDPMTKFSFTGEIDAYGQPLSQISIAVPRGKDPRTGLELSGHSGVYYPARGYDATIQYTEHIYRDVPATDPASSVGISYAVDRVKQARSFEAVNNGSMPVFALRDDMLRPTAQWTLATPKLLALSYTYYDGGPFYGMPYGQMELYGLPVRTETLMVQPAELAAAYGPPPAPFNGSNYPNWSGHPADFVNELPDARCGYRYRTGGPEQFVPGYYTTAQALAYDFQGWSMAETVVGLPMAMQDAYESTAYVQYDPYQLFPTTVVDPLGMATYAGYDYRVMQVAGVMDVNMNVTLFGFTPLGLMNKTAVLGKYDAPEGDSLDTPGVLLEYDLFAFMLRGEPVWVKTTQREHHVNAPYAGSMLPDEFNATLVAVEYSDGFGRQLQTRTQAESVLFGVTSHPGGVDGLGSSGLPADQGAPNAPAVGRQSPPPPYAFVTVSGAKLYNNKGKVVEQWEPYFSQGFALTDPATQHGQRVRIYYDALGRPKRTVNPDATEQRVVYGVPNALDTPDAFAPSSWERYTYDANDLAGLTHPEDTTVPPEHRWTPKSEVVDALGRTIMTVEHCAPLSSGEGPGVRPEDVVMGYAYDIKGQLLKVTDPLDRVCFEHKYDTAGNTLWTKHLDSGVRTVVVDAQGKPLYSNDAKGARTYTSYDRLNRPTGVWARDTSVSYETFTRRQTLIYGDQSDVWPREDRNLWGRLYQHYDEAGKVQVEGYDFKGNPLEKTRWVIKDSAIWSGTKLAVDWTPMDESILDTRLYTTTLTYDALNRVRTLTYPEDANSQRQELTPRYNRAGALERMDLQGTPVLEHVAYNAKGQRILMARPNGFHTRYAYDPVTFRLQRIRTERFSRSGNTYTPLSGNVRQDTGYEYDLGGNITKIKERVTDCGITGSLLGSDALDKTFEYDPLKRLLKATGREGGTKWNGDHWTPVSASTASPNANNVRAYTRRYSYDKVGNVQDLVHQAISNNYTRHYNYVGGKNHLASIDSGGSPPSVNASFQYDVNGNLVKNDTARFYEWNAADQLAYTKLQP